MNTCTQYKGQINSSGWDSCVVVTLSTLCNCDTLTLFFWTTNLVVVWKCGTLTVWWDWWLAQMAQVHRPLAGGSPRTQGHQICSIQTLIQGFAGTKYLEKRRNPIWTGGSRSKAIGQDRSKDIRWDQTKGTQDLTYFLAFVKCQASVETFVLLLSFKKYTSNWLQSELNSECAKLNLGGKALYAGLWVWFLEERLRGRTLTLNQGLELRPNHSVHNQEWCASGSSGPFTKLSFQPLCLDTQRNQCATRTVPCVCIQC